MLGAKLKEYGLKTKPGTGGLTDLVWDEEKINNILFEIFQLSQLCQLCQPG